VRAIGGGIGLILSELAFPQATARDEDLLKKDPKPCDKDKKNCEQAKQDCIDACLGELGKGGRMNQGFPFRNCVRRCLVAAGCEGYGNFW
jgi:hypothetical protein